jgi:hypothetical protein
MPLYDISDIHCLKNSTEGNLMLTLVNLSPKTLPNYTIGALAAVLLLSTSASSFAIDAKTVVERFTTFNSSQGQKFAYTAIEDDNGDSFNLKGATLTFPSAKPVMISNIQFNGVVENSDSSITIGSVVYENINFADENIVVTMDEAAAKNFNLPSKESSDAVKNFVYFTNFTGKNLNVVVDGKPVGGMAALNMDYGEIIKGQPIAMKGDMSGITVDLTGVDDAKFKQGLEKLGYDGKFSGSINMGGSWNPGDGRVEVSNYDIKLDNIGTLSILLTLSGYTAELAQQLQTVSAEAQGNPQAAGMAMMAELPKLFFESAKINFTDDSITRRVLKMQAATMGGTADDVAKMVPVMMPMMLGGLGNPEFSTMLTGAVGRFVSQPGNITITAKPEKPLPFSEIMGIGMAAPTSLIGALAVKVTANE